MLRTSEVAPRVAWARVREGLLVAGLLAVTLLAYGPALHGEFLWDDDAHVTRPELRSWQGLGRIWFELDATQQYYPLLHTVFWVQWHLWGDSTLGYHIVNVVLHVAAAVLGGLVLRRLEVPGAYLAAAIFALHPVHVESVAWVTELKNTLSAVFYLSAALLYLRFDESRHKRWYGAALALFLLGLLCKTVTATLPAALLVIFWWQRGRLSWRRDGLPLVPWFVVGALAGVFTAAVERKLIGAEGESFDLTAIERCLIAGRAMWFYLGKLVWPADLMFMYPRWNIAATAWWQYLFPAAALALLGGLWRLRRRTRSPLAGILFFVGTLFPALGFLNVYPFRYSFVADHFQYLASWGVISLAAAGLALWLGRRHQWRHPVGYAVCFVLLAALAGLTRQQSRLYAGFETLFRTTIARNPTCWMAHNNLGIALAQRGQVDEASEHFRRSLEIKPDHAEAHNNLSVALQQQGKLDDAIAHARTALGLNPNYAECHFHLGNTLNQKGQVDEAIGHFERALEIRPNYTKAHINLGIALLGRRRLDEAEQHFRRVLELEPDHLGARQNLGVALDEQGKTREALEQWRDVLRRQPDQVAILNRCAWILATDADQSVRNSQEAVALAERAFHQTQGRDATVLDTLAAAYAEAGQFPEAVQTARMALTQAEALGNTTLAEALRQRVQLYRTGMPHRDPRN
jgi:tetratricopeptide (TPR) repeat protein